MQIQRRQKGFTLVELLVVIAIIAILATVSIIGYTQFIKRANMSADQQAVTQMNTLLEGLDVNNEPDDVVDLWTYLRETGLDAEDYKPLSKDHYFFWDQSLNRILLVDKDDKVVFPKAYAEPGKANKNKWHTLSGTIHLGEKPAIEGGAVAIANASDVIQVMADNAAGVQTMTLSDNVNMMGASHGSISLNSNFTLDGGDKTLANLVSTEHGSVGVSAEYANKKYNSGLFGDITGGTVVIQNIEFDGLVIGSYETGCSGILAGAVASGATLIVKNVTIRNCTLYGQNKVGIIAGSVTGTVKLENVKIIDCIVNASEGEAGKLFGVAYDNGKVTADADCSIENTVVNNVEYDLHEIVVIGGQKWMKKVKYKDGPAKVEVKELSTGIFYTALTRCATEDSIGWKYPASYGYEVVGGSYCARPADEVTDIATLAPAP
jgi:prepilin-type N-terminal cleavage/methylation domain-containing protein